VLRTNKDRSAGGGGGSMRKSVAAVALRSRKATAANEAVPFREGTLLNIICSSRAYAISQWLLIVAAATLRSGPFTPNTTTP